MLKPSYLIYGSFPHPWSCIPNNRALKLPKCHHHHSESQQHRMVPLPARHLGFYCHLFIKGIPSFIYICSTQLMTCNHKVSCFIHVCIRVGEFSSNHFWLKRIRLIVTGNLIASSLRSNGSTQPSSAFIIYFKLESIQDRVWPSLFQPHMHVLPLP